MPNLTAFEVLLAIAKTGSLGAAGRSLNLTQQAISARVAALEAQTGVPLVTRSTRGSQLTNAGVVAVQWADRLLQVAREVDAGLASLRENTKARVRVCASMTIAEQLLPGWLVSLQAAAAQRGSSPPVVVLTATNSEQVAEAVRAGSADLGFVEGPRAPRGLRGRVIAHDELVLVVRPDHPWARPGRVVDAAQLAASSLVVREPGSGTRSALTAALAAVLGPDAVQAAPSLELATAASVRAAVLAGAGPAVLSGLAVRDDIAAGRLRRVAVTGINLHRELRAVWLGGRTPPAGAVRDLLAHIGALTASGATRPT